MGRPRCGISDSAVEAQAQAIISQPQRVSCPRREHAVRCRRLPRREFWALSVSPATAPGLPRAGCQRPGICMMVVVPRPPIFWMRAMPSPAAAALCTASSRLPPQPSAAAVQRQQPPVAAVPPMCANCQQGSPCPTWHFGPTVKITSEVFRNHAGPHSADGHPRAGRCRGPFYKPCRLYKPCRRGMLRDPLFPNRSFRSGIGSQCPPAITSRGRCPRCSM